MKNILVLFFLSSFLFAQSVQINVYDIVKAIDKNLNAESRIVTSKMVCLLYTSPSPRDGLLSRMPSSA